MKNLWRPIDDVLKAMTLALRTNFEILGFGLEAYKFLKLEDSIISWLNKMKSNQT